MVAMQSTRRPRPGKKPVNLSINGDLLAVARKLNINLSATLEAALAEAIKREQRARWLGENEAAIAAYNERIDTHGAFSDGLRKF